MPCDICRDRGYTLNADQEFMGFCSCPMGIKHKRAFWERSLNAAGIFSEYWHKNMSDFYPQSDFPAHKDFVTRTAQTIGKLDALRNTNFLWIIHGGKGTGKTLAGALVLMEAIRKGYPSRYVIWSDLISKRMEHDDKDTLEQLKNVDFLVIDKVNGDTIKDPKFPAETLDLILGYRYGNQKPTIVILDTNLTDAKRRLPVLGELAGTSNVSEVTGLNYRITTIK